MRHLIKKQEVEGLRHFQISSLQDQLLKYEQSGNNKAEIENNTIKSKSRSNVSIT